MTTDLEARMAVESLRAGVPGYAAVKTLGTTQDSIAERFIADIESLEAGTGSAPIALSGNFGNGKSHLLQYLRAEAERRGFVTSMVVVSPEMRIGDAHVVLKAIAEESVAPGRTGKAVMELASNAPAGAIADLIIWARNAPIKDRFRALLRVFKATTDEELRMAILGDVEGRPILKTALRQALAAMQELSHYDLSSPRNPLLAHDRLRILGQFCHSHGAKGLVVFFDELERIVSFPFRARLSAYEEIGWWNSVCQEPNSRIYAVFAQTTGSIEQCLRDKGDESKIGGTTLIEFDERDRLAKEGIALLRSAKDLPLQAANQDQFDRLQHGVRSLYQRAYGVTPGHLQLRTNSTTIRSEIRRWITVWDLRRHYPAYDPDVTATEVQMDTHDMTDEELPVVDETSAAED